MPDCSKISAAVVTYNNGDKAVAIASILTHCKKYPVDLYIIDNNSTDDTLERIRRIAPGAKIIKLKKNIGFGAAHNRILEQLDSSYHFVINPDITVSSDVFADMAEYMEEHPDTVITSPNVLNADGTIQHLPKSVPTFKRLFFGRLSKKIRNEYVWRDKVITAPCEINFCSGCFFCIKTECFKQMAGFDERYFMYLEDADLTLRAKKAGKTVFLPYVNVTHLWERGSYKNLKLLFIHIVSCVKFLVKWRHKI